MCYIKESDMKKVFEKTFEEYWIRIFNIVEEKEIYGKTIKKDNSLELKKLRETVSQWEKTIIEYCNETKSDFDLDLFDDNNDERYEFQEFKDNIFAKDLWTVKSALKNAKFDEELKKYRDQFLKTSAAEIFITVKDILLKTSEYVYSIAKNINYNRISDIKQLKIDYLNDENMLLTGVIGLGIRSEILHKLYPGNFALMTRRSIWGSYFLSSEAEEFIKDEKGIDGKKQRTSHNWEYEYDRFLFYNNFVGNLLENKFNKYDIKMKQNLRFGYVNMFFNKVSDMHKTEIDSLFQWIYEE